MARLFITGTGTDVGKTTVCGALLAGLSATTMVGEYHKPLETGGRDIDSESARRLAENGARIHPTRISLSAPLSPDQAARRDGVMLPSASELAAGFPGDPGLGKILLIEGAGGVQVPINAVGETWIDVVRQARIPALLVGRNALGTINHTSLTILALQNAGVDVVGVVLVGSTNKENAQSLAQLHPDISIHVLPAFQTDSDRAFLQSDAEAAAIFVERQLVLWSRTREAGPVLRADRHHVWHPYTQHQLSETPLLAIGASGATIELDDGRKIVDGSGSWWVNTVGHGRREIGRAIHRQQQELDHVIFAGLTHRPAASLADKILRFSDSHLDRVFFSDNGSTAVEVALKMAYQSFVNRGESKRKSFLAFHGGYHGDTFGSMAVGQSDGFHGVFRPLLFRSLWATAPTSHPSRFCPEGSGAYDRYLKELSELLAVEHQTLAGVVIEPLVQGAAGMLMQPKLFLKDLAELCRTYDLPLIFDEVFTGMGRVGAPFAFKAADVCPDIVCVAKGLTGGTMPLAMTLTTERIFTAFLAIDKGKALLHGHSYTGNPIACSAAIATLEILDREKLVQRARELAENFASWLTRATERFGVENSRTLGGILAFELPGTGFGNYFDARSSDFAKFALENGLFIRTLGNTVYFVPPLSISQLELRQSLNALERSLEYWLI